MADFSNSGLLKINDRREKPEHPALKGSQKIDNCLWWLDGYVSDDKKTIELKYNLADDRDTTGKGKITLQDTTDKKPGYPAYKGQGRTEDGFEFWIAGWRKGPAGKIDKPWISLSIEAKDKPRDEPEPEEPQAHYDESSDLPF